MRKSLSVKVMKVLALFTSLQAFTILCSVVKMKLVALWLKSVGVGLFGVFQTTIDTIGILTEMGLRESAVRDVAQHQGNPGMLSRIMTVVRRWSCVSGLLGALVITMLSPWLAEYLLGAMSRWWCFALLSATLLLKSLLNGEQAILQGSQHLKALAKSTFYGTLVGLLVSIPMYRYMGEVSVVLSLAVYAVTMYGSVLLFRHNVSSEEKISWKVTVSEGKGFVKMGAFMSIAAFVENVARLVFLGWLNDVADMSEVGYYQAGYTMVVRYVGMIFAAIVMEFYPRLSQTAHSRRRTQVYVSHEICLLLKVLMPVIVVFLLFRGLITDLLYTPEFRVIIPFISWAVCGMIFRVVSSCMAVTILARGDGKAYIMTETLDSVVGLALNIWLYGKCGLEGLGIAYMLWYLIYCLLTGAVYFGRYGMRLSRGAWLAILLSILVAAATIAAVGGMAWQ